MTSPFAAERAGQSIPLDLIRPDPPRSDQVAAGSDQVAAGSSRFPTRNSDSLESGSSPEGLTGSDRI